VALRLRSVLPIALILIALGLSGCSNPSNGAPAAALPTSLPATDGTSPPPVPPSPSARVVVTTNFGKRLVLDTPVDLATKSSAMEALRAVAEVKTAYGGGFVKDINGARAEYGKFGDTDWFLYINGIQTKSGALDYTLRPGDIEHWDLHDWGFHSFIPALIGDFPEPFVHGYGGETMPTIIVYDDTFQEEAAQLVKLLTRLGAEEVSTRRIEELSKDEKESCNLILLGDRNSPLVAEVNKLWKRMGFFARFDGDKLVILNSKGKAQRELGAGAGLIQATQNPWNPKGIGVCENVVWMVTGTDESGVRKAAALVNRYEEFQWAFGIAVSEGEIIKVPK